MSNTNIERAYKWLQTHYWTRRLGLNGNTPLLNAADKGRLEKVPKHTITQATLTRFEEGNYYSPLHYAAEQRQLDQIPKEFLTKQNICLKNVHGETVLHFAAGNNCVDQIPDELLTEELFRVQTTNNVTPLHWAAEANNMENIPARVLTDRNLLMSMHTVGVQTLATADNKEGTVIGMLKSKGQMHVLLGLELGKECQEIAGAEWCEQNNAVIQARQALLPAETQEASIDLF